MIDLKDLRGNPEKFREGWAKKGQTIDVERVLGMDAEWRQTLTQLEEARARLNTLAKEVGKARANGDDASALLNESRQVSARIEELQRLHDSLESPLNNLLLELPNLPADEVPAGSGEEENRVVREWGEPPAFPFAPKSHWDLGESLGVLDFERGAKISGSRFYILKGAGARLERALIGFMLDLHTRENRYTEVFTPFLVRRECMVGTGQLPKFEEDMYHLEADDLYLDPTGEVPVTNLHRDEILNAEALPIKYAAYTACFRREAGAAGKDVRGVIRVHQFNKVELVKFATPETSDAEFHELLSDAEQTLQGLGLHYRVVQMCTGDLGFAARNKADLEVWYPGQSRFVEVSSVSHFGDFQARRANIRYRPAPNAKPQFVHTLNGSGLAVGRTFAAVLENFQQADGSIRVPGALQPYFGSDSIP